MVDTMPRTRKAMRMPASCGPRSSTISTVGIWTCSRRKPVCRGEKCMFAGEIRPWTLTWTSTATSTSTTQESVSAKHAEGFLPSLLYTTAEMRRQGKIERRWPEHLLLQPLLRVPTTRPSYNDTHPKRVCTIPDSSFTRWRCVSM